MTQDPLIVHLLKNLTFAPGARFSYNKPMLLLGDNKILFHVKHQDNHLQFYQAYWTMEHKYRKSKASLCYDGYDPASILPLSHLDFQECDERNLTIRCREIVSQCITPRAVALENALNQLSEYLAHEIQAEWLMIRRNGQLEWMENDGKHIHQKNLFDHKDHQNKIVQDIKQSYLIRNKGTKIGRLIHTPIQKVEIMSNHQILEKRIQIEEALLELGYPHKISIDYKP